MKPGQETTPVSPQGNKRKPRTPAPIKIAPGFAFTDPGTLEGSVRIARLVSKNLNDLIEHYIDMGWVRSRSQFAEKLGMHPSVIRNIIEGEGWATIETIARIELKTGRRIYPAVKEQRKKNLKPEFLQEPQLP